MYGQCKIKLLAENPGSLVPRQCQECGVGSCKFTTESGIKSDLYRSKPTLVYAFQITQATRMDNKDWPQWLNEAWQKDHNEIGSLYSVDYPNSTGVDTLVLVTPQGHIGVAWDDWLVKRTEGSIALLTPAIFGLYYESVI